MLKLNLKKVYSHSEKNFTVCHDRKSPIYSKKIITPNVITPNA